MVSRAAGFARWSTLAPLAIALFACGDGSAPAPKTERGQPAVDVTTLRRGNGPEPDSLDPQRARTDNAFNVLRDLFEGLTAIGDDGMPEPAAAESWTITPDGREYRFRLREGLRWSNGDPVVAQDFVVGLRRLVDPQTASQYAQVLEPVVNASAIIRGEKPPAELGVDAPDDRTLVLRLVNPAPYVLGLVAHPSTFPVHAASLARHGTDFARPGRLVSNGAFTLEDWVVGSHIVVVRNRNYWDDAHTRLERVRFVHHNDAGTEFREYRAGQLDATYVVPAQEFAWIREHLAPELHIAPQLGTYYYGFNLTRPPFKGRPGLRRALSLVIDRERLTAAVTGVGEAPAYGFVARGVANYTPQRFDYAERPYEERVSEARRLYAEAGYSAANPLRTEIRYNTGDAHSRIAIAIAAMWKETLGVETSLYAEELRAWLQSIEARKDTQVFRSSWIGDFNDPYTFLQLLQSDFGINLTAYSNPEYDALLASAAVNPDLAARRAGFEAAERLMLADHPLLPLYFYVNKHLVKPYVRGWSDNIMNFQYSRRISLEPDQVAGQMSRIQ